MKKLIHHPVRCDSRSIFEIHKRIKNGKVKVVGSDNVTDIKDSTIELVCCGIPLPIVMATEDTTGNITIVSDAIGWIMSYLDNEFTVKSEYVELNGFKFSELGNRLKNRIEDTTIQMAIVSPNNQTDLRLINNLKKVIAY